MRRILIAALAAVMVVVMLGGEALADPKAYDYWVVATRPCDTRVEPEPDAAVNGMMEKGDETIYEYEFQVDSEGTVWYLVDTRDGLGWIDANSVRLMGECGVICEGDRFEVGMDAMFIRATGGDTNIRDMPNKDTFSVGVLKKGEAAIFAGLRYTDARDMTWFYVEFEDENGEGRDGWVSYRYTTPE